MTLCRQKDGKLYKIGTGGVKVTESSAVTEPGVAAADARQLNAAAPGTLAYSVKQMEGQLKEKAGLGRNFYGGAQIAQVNIHPGAGAAAEAQVQSRCSMNEDAYARAGYGFYNAGHNHGFLYLDSDSCLKFVDNTGRTKTVSMA